MPIAKFKPQAVNLRSVPGVDTSAQRATQNLMQSVSGIFNQINKQANVIADERAKIEGFKSGVKIAKNSDGKEVFDKVAAKDDLTIFGQAQFEAAATSFAIQQSADIDATINDIAAKNFNDPEAFAAEAQAAIKGFTKGVPASVGQELNKLAMRKVAAHQAKIAKARAKSDFEDSQSIIANEMTAIGTKMTTAIQQGLDEEVSTLGAKAQGVLQAAVNSGILTEQGAALKQQEFLQEVQKKSLTVKAARAGSMKEAMSTLRGAGMETPEMINSVISLRNQEQSAIEADNAEREKARKRKNQALLNQFVATSIDSVDPEERQIVRQNMVDTMLASGATSSEIKDAVSTFTASVNFATQVGQDFVESEVQSIIDEAGPDMEEQVNQQLAKIRDPKKRRELKNRAQTRRQYLALDSDVQEMLEIQLDNKIPIFKTDSFAAGNLDEAYNKWAQRKRSQARGMLVEAIRTGEVSRSNIPSYINDTLVRNLMGGSENVAYMKAVNTLPDKTMAAQLRKRMTKNTELPFGSQEFIDVPKLSKGSAQDVIDAIIKSRNTITDPGRRRALQNEIETIREIFINE